MTSNHRVFPRTDSRVSEILNHINRSNGDLFQPFETWAQEEEFPDGVHLQTQQKKRKGQANSSE